MSKPNFKVSTANNDFINTKHISYTPDQEKAIISILKWYKSTNDTVMTLKGHAGTGKTTILGEIVANLKTSIVCTAPTHQAVRQVSKSIGAQAFTIHKLLGLYPNLGLENFDHNNPKFDPRGKQYLTDYNLCIVDESSMIPTAIDKQLVSLAKSNNSKILYVGDPYQLPPITKNKGFEISIPAFKHKGVQLTTVMRQDPGNTLLPLIEMVREDIINNTDNFIRYIYKNPINFNKELGKGYISTRDKDYFHDLIYDKFTESEYFSNINHVKYLAFTNDNINEYNQFIRNKLVYSNGDMLCKDDLLLAYSSVLDEFNSLVITNSDNYIIYNNNLSTFRKSGIDGYLAKLQNVDSAGNDITKLLFFVDHTNPTALSAYMKVFNGLINKSKTASDNRVRKEAWKQFFAFKNTHLLMQKLTHKGQLITGNDFSYGHGMTIHKSQGSTYDNIFINIRDIVYSAKTGMPYPNRSIRNRLLYVALSRARNLAILYI